MKNYTESEKEIYLSGYKDGKEETMKTVVSVAEFVGKCWTMFLIAAGLIFLIIVSASKCHAQDNKPPVIKVPDYPQYEVKVIARADDGIYYHYDKGINAFAKDTSKYKDNYDTIPVSLLVRISGKPWAFFHDGWEVRKASEDPGKYLPMQEPCTIPGCAVYHPLVLRPRKTYSHLVYLDSRKRPIRKEWVVYQTFKR